MQQDPNGLISEERPSDQEYLSCPLKHGRSLRKQTGKPPLEQESSQDEHYDERQCRELPHGRGQGSADHLQSRLVSVGRGKHKCCSFSARAVAS